MPLQRNFSDLNKQEVSPIYEDSKDEETVIGEIEGIGKNRQHKIMPKFTRIKKVKFTEEKGSC